MSVLWTGLNDLPYALESGETLERADQKVHFFFIFLVQSDKTRKMVVFTPPHSEILGCGSF